MNLIEYLYSIIFPRKQNDGADIPDYSDVISSPVIPDDDPIIEDEIIIPPASNYHWIIDAGHGSLTEGKRSPVLPEGGQLLEYEYTGKIARRICERLKELNIDHTLNPPSQVGIGNYLKERVALANSVKSSKQRIFVSVHGNAGPVPNSRTDWSINFSGIEVWHFTPSSQSKHLAQIFQNALVKRMAWNNRGIKSQTANQFYVLRYTKMPAILTENGFYNNIRECRLMLQDETVNQFAEAHIDAIKLIELNKSI